MVVFSVKVQAIDRTAKSSRDRFRSSLTSTGKRHTRKNGETMEATSY